MIRSLVGLPFRLGARWAGVAAHGTAEVADRAFGLVGLVSHALSGPREPDVDLDGSPHNGASAKRTGAGSRSRPAPPAPPAPAVPPVPETAPPPVAQPETAPPPVAPPETAAPPLAPPLETPDHVSEEPTLVDSVAELGAEDGAGAQIHVGEPWDGYRQMNADDVIERITGSPTAVLAAVELYERAGRGRRSILAAVERQLRRANG